MLEKITKVNGALRKPGVREKLDDAVKTDTKNRKRLAIQDDVFDSQDSVADNAKMISLLTTIISRMYDTMTTTQKSKIPSADRDVIEYTFNSFKETTTRADSQMVLEGTGLIDKLLSRQANINNILQGV